MRRYKWFSSEICEKYIITWALYYIEGAIKNTTPQNSQKFDSFLDSDYSLMFKNTFNCFFQNESNFNDE